MAIPNTTTAPKTAITSATVNAQLIAAANQSSATTTNLAQNQGSAGNSKANPPQGFAGPAPNLPSTPGKSSADSFTHNTPADKQAAADQAMGLVSKTDAIRSLADTLTGLTTGSTTTAADDPLLASTIKTDKASFNQGFPGKPAGLTSTPVTSGPMDAFSGNSVGGLLGALAAGNKPAPTPSSGAAGSGLVAGFVDDVKNFLDDVGEGLYALLIRQPQDGTPNKNEGEQLKELEKESKSNTPPAPEPTPAPTPTPGMPAPDNTGSGRSYLTQPMLNQIIASKAGKPASQGGGGDVTPVDNGGVAVGGPTGSIATNQASLQGQRLFGQPVNPALENKMSGGGASSLNVFRSSNGAGAINPGDEAASPAGDPRYQQDPANAIPNNGPATPPPGLPGAQNTPSEQTSSISATLAAGVRNLTLTGTATINGTGNGLDNLINGNAAANELRGEAGNDLLDGGAGRDQLTGGSGADRFRFSTAGAFGTALADRITDFSRSDGDRIELSRAAFGLAAGTTLTFQAVSSDADLSRALGSSTLLVQDLRDGSILFNQNGSAAGAGQGGVFAVVSQGLTMQAGDFVLGA